MKKGSHDDDFFSAGVSQFRSSTRRAREARREAIRERARKGLIRRMKRGQYRVERSNLVEARVHFVDETKIKVLLPRNRIQSTLAGMEENGFWYRHEGDDLSLLVFQLPKMIKFVTFDL
jgi:hypothetical protein